MKAVGKYIVIEEEKDKTKETKGGLLISSKQLEDIRYKKAKILNTGTEVEGVKINDNIYFDKHAGFDIEIKGDVYKVIKEQDIVIVI